MGLRPDLEQRRRDIIACVLREFKDVKRTGGVSWSQTFVMDDYGSAELITAAAEQDREIDWIELARHGPWNVEAGMGCGGWSFLDAIGARYYLAAAMLMDLERAKPAGVELALETGPRDIRWSLLSEEHAAVVALYLRWKRDIAGIAHDRHSHRQFVRILESGWDAQPTSDHEM